MLSRHYRCLTLFYSLRSTHNQHQTQRGAFSARCQVHYVFVGTLQKTLTSSILNSTAFRLGRQTFPLVWCPGCFVPLRLTRAAFAALVCGGAPAPEPPRATATTERRALLRLSRPCVRAVAVLVLRSVLRFTRARSSVNWFLSYIE